MPRAVKYYKRRQRASFPALSMQKIAQAHLLCKFLFKRFHFRVLMRMRSIFGRSVVFENVLKGRKIAVAETFRSEFVDVDGLRLHYTEAGSGDPIVLLHDLHGGNSGRFHWSKNIGPLSEKFRVIALDLPNAGESGAVVFDKPRFQFMAELLDTFLKLLDIERAHLVGGGPGGGMATQLATSFPDRVDRLVVAGAGLGKPLFYPGPTEGAMSSMKSAFEPSIDGLKAALQFLVSNPALITEEMVAECFENMQAHPEHVDATRKIPFEFYIPSPPPFEEIEKIQAKTLVLWGREDRMGTIDAGLRYLHYIADAQLHIFPNCGNWVPFEKADEFNRMVKAFLSDTL